MKIRAKRPVEQRSFTLIETVIALVLLMPIIIGVVQVQGNAIYFTEYNRNVIQASWLARRVMDQVQHLWLTRDFKDLAVETRLEPFQDFPDYSYTINIKEWDLDIAKMLTGGLGGGGEEDEGGDDYASEDPAGGLVEDAVKQIFGDEAPFMVAKVEVSWPEGATRNATSLTYLLTNQKKIDEFLPTFQKSWKDTREKKRGTGRGGDKNNPGTPNPGDPGAPPVDPNEEGDDT